MKLKLGTRGSKLALAQSHQLVAELKKYHPTLDVETVIIKTDGDRDRTTPLWQMKTVGIFSADIDEAVLNGDVDFAVHSLKDLGTKRPDGLKLAAISKRANPRDVLLFRGNVLEKIKNGETIVIGSSAPRRVELLPSFLDNAFPKLSDKKPTIKTTSIRGNIDSRIERLHLDASDEKAVDGICLAMAGLSRLYQDDKGYETLSKSLKGLKWMVLPVTSCPGAPGQGALAVEIKEGRDDLVEIFKAVHDLETEKFVNMERELLIQQGGGCHQRFGALALRLPNMLEDVLIVEGVNTTGQDISAIYLNDPYDFKDKNIWSGVEWRSQMIKTTPVDFKLPQKIKAVFATHARAVPDTLSKDVRLWTSGVASWFSLATKGFWVEGCADGFGFEFIRDTLNDLVLELPDLTDWTILTHTDAKKDWTVGMPIATYSVTYEPNDKAITALQAADIILWSSGSQYQALKHHAKPGALHASGPGKTAETLKKDGGQAIVLPSVMGFVKTAPIQGKKHHG